MNNKNCSKTFVKRLPLVGLNILLLVGLGPFLSSALASESYFNLKSPLYDFKQLSFTGQRAGEGYFSADGSWMIFQSEREPKNPFYQIYLADLRSGQVKLVSPGVGRATCGWIHPNKRKVLYSSTHQDPLWTEKAQQEIEFRKNPKSKKYSWDFDSEYRIFEQDLRSGKTKNLTPWMGYSAEASYSPDGQWVAFASNGHAYANNPGMSLENPEKEMEIYIMRSNGGGLKRLTFEPGYDGGPFFSPDGTHITWRRFNGTGDQAEIYTMKIDGSEKKQITRMGAMAWAPFYHPSGDYIVFTTNVHGYDNFELYIVDSQGERPPQRVSERPGFDGLPVFHPSGRWLSWTFRNLQGESQIYMGRWSDGKARELLGIAEIPSRKPELIHNFKKEILKEDLRVWVEHLADPYFEGRKTGSENLWMGDLQKYLNDLGLVTWRESFPFVQGMSLGAANNLKINGQPLVLEGDFKPSVFSSTGVLEEGEYIYANSGLVAEGYDAYRSLVVSGKWVGIDENPLDLTPDQRAKWSNDLHLQYRILEAKRRGAKAVLVFSDRKDFKFLQLSKGESLGLGVFLVSTQVKSKLQALSQSGSPQSIDSGAGNPAGPSSPRLSGSVDLNRIMGSGQVLMAELRVHYQAKTFVLGAHGDHLGQGHSGSSLATEGEMDRIHTGADDNASGVAVVMELAGRLAKSRQNLRSNYVFAVWSGEEMGLLGSNHILKNWKGPKIAMGLNFDMVGRLRDSLKFQGTGSSPLFRPLLESLAVQLRDQISINSSDSPFAPTDSMSFQNQKIPALNFFTGTHPEYHTPRDRAETINYDGLYSITQVALRMLMKLDKFPEIPYQEANLSASGGDSSGRKFKVYLGTIPSYQGDSSQAGVLLSGVTPGSPAQKAGIQAGDILVRIADIQIAGMREFGFALKTLEVGKSVEFELVRAGRKVVVQVIPESRDN